MSSLGPEPHPAVGPRLVEVPRQPTHHLVRLEPLAVRDPARWHPQPGPPLVDLPDHLLGADVAELGGDVVDERADVGRTDGGPVTAHGGEQPAEPAPAERLDLARRHPDELVGGAQAAARRTPSASPTTAPGRRPAPRSWASRASAGDRGAAALGVVGHELATQLARPGRAASSCATPRLKRPIPRSAMVVGVDDVEVERRLLVVAAHRGHDDALASPGSRRRGRGGSRRGARPPARPGTSAVRPATTSTSALEPSSEPRSRRSGQTPSWTPATTTSRHSRPAAAWGVSSATASPDGDRATRVSPGTSWLGCARGTPRAAPGQPVDEGRRGVEQGEHGVEVTVGARRRRIHRRGRSPATPRPARWPPTSPTAPTRR